MSDSILSGILSHLLVFHQSFYPSLCEASEDFHLPKTHLVSKGRCLNDRFQIQVPSPHCDKLDSGWSSDLQLSPQKDRRHGTNIEVEAPLRRNSWYYQDSKCWSYWNFSPTPLIRPRALSRSLTIWYPIGSTASNIDYTWLNSDSNI